MYDALPFRSEPTVLVAAEWRNEMSLWTGPWDVKWKHLSTCRYMHIYVVVFCVCTNMKTGSMDRVGYEVEAFFYIQYAHAQICTGLCSHVCRCEEFEILQRWLDNCLQSEKDLYSGNKLERCRRLSMQTNGWNEAFVVQCLILLLRLNLGLWKGRMEEEWNLEEQLVGRWREMSDEYWVLEIFIHWGELSNEERILLLCSDDDFARMSCLSEI